ncbi:unnamed protein product [Strongylus vulgaris]|uniref:Uncharacterized protein n=1 Tax=Strongylus vulgaris TaxID=40348 RepID=A0A3P7IA58_STRVU|nr:unnamed protein product [Strongylus vulgaris]
MPLQVSPSSSVSPVNLSGEEGSVNDAESLESSMSTKSVQFEDIDDPLQTALISTTEMYDSMFMDDSTMYHEYHLSSRSGYTFQELRYLDEYMVDSSYSGTDSNVTLTDSRTQADSTEVSAPMAGTPIDLINFSTLLSSELAEAAQNQDSSETGTVMARNTSGSSTTGGKTSSSSFAKLSDEDSNTCEKLLGGKDRDNDKGSNALTTSCVDSGIGGTISTHSELSAFCLSPQPLAESSCPQQSKLAYNVEEQLKSTHDSAPGSFDDDVVSFLDLPLDSPSDHIGDEFFVSKFVLAEQVFR